MGPSLNLYRQALKNFGIKKENDFYFSILIMLFISMTSSLTQTFINLDLHQFHFFNKEVLSLDIMMPFLGSFVALFVFQRLFHMVRFKIFMGFTLLGIGLGYFLLIFFVTSDFNFIIRFFLGLFYSFTFLGCYIFQMKVYHHHKRGALFSFTILMMALSSSFGFFLNGVITDASYVFGVGLICIGGCLWSLLKLDTTEEDSQGKKEFLSPHGSILKIASKYPRFFILILLISFVGTAFPTYFPIYAEGLGFSEKEVSYLFSCVQLSLLFFIPLGGFLGDKWGYEKILLVLSFVALLAGVCTFGSKKIEILGILFFIIRGSLASFFGLMVAWIAREHFSQRVATRMSVFSFTYRAGCILSPLGVGFIMQYYGNNGFIFFILGGIFLSICLLLKEVFPKENDLKKY
ncbi:MAG: MFS transporter [Proteobacteria bacterium]|nr:MFS transporter [Pseudomonadota bacterium]